MQHNNLPEFQVGRLKDRLLGPISGYYRAKVSLSKQSIEAQAVLPFVAVSRDENIAIVKNSKSGCTSLIHALYTYDTGLTFDGNIHREGSHLRQGYAHWEQNKSSLMSGDTFVVSAVRNPIKRIVSAYFDFVVEKINPMRKYHVEDFQRYGLIDPENLNVGFDAFLDLVEASLAKNPWTTERHWRLQKHNLWTDEIRYDLIMRTEQFGDGYENLRAELGLPESRFPLVRSNVTASSIKFSPTASAQRKIERIYAEDFEQFEGSAQ